MGKLESGLYGIIRGKTSDLNFKYSGGKNIVSKYVPNPHNPKTPAQLQVRAKLKFFSQLYKGLSPTFLNVALAHKHNGKTGMQKFIGGSCSAFDGTAIDFMTIPQVIIDLIMDLLDDWHGTASGRPIKPPTSITESLFFDRVKFNVNQQNQQPVLLVETILNKSLSFQELPKFIQISNPLQNGDLPCNGVFSICQHNQNSYDASTGTYPSIDTYYINVNSHRTWFGLCMLPKSITLGLANEISLYNKAPVSSIINPDQNTNFYFINTSILNQLPLSKIDKCTGLIITKSKFVDANGIVPIDWQFELKESNISLTFPFTSPNYNLLGTVIFDLPTIYEGFSWFIQIDYFEYNALGEPVKHTVKLDANTNDIDVIIPAYNDNSPLAALMYVVIDNRISSVPVKLYYNQNRALNPVRDIYSHLNDSPFRYPSFADDFNFCCKFVKDNEGQMEPAENVIVTFYDELNNSVGEIYSDNLGVCLYKIPANKYIKKAVAIAQNLIVFNVDIKKMVNDSIHWDLGIYNLSDIS